MQIAQVLAGYSLGEADLLRRAMGKKIRKEMEAQRERFVSGAVERGVERHQAGGDLRAAGALRRLRLQQEPRRGLRARRLPDRLHEGELSGRVPGRVDDARHEQYRQARGIPRRGGAARHQGRAALGQSLGRRLRGRGQHHPSTRSRRSRASARRRSRRSSRRAATGRSATSPTSPAASIRAPSTSGCWKASPPPARSTRSSPTARAPLPPSTRCSRSRSATHEAAAVGQNELFGGRRRREPPGDRRRSQPWLPAERLQKEFDADRLLPLRPSARRLCRARSSACGCSPGPSSRARCAAGATAGRVAATVVSRTERRTKTGNKMGIFGLSDPSGHYEAVIFAEGLQQYRDLLEPGKAVLLQLGAELQGDEVRARIQTVEPLDKAAEKLSQGCASSCARTRRSRGSPSASTARATARSAWC